FSASVIGHSLAGDGSVMRRKSARDGLEGDSRRLSTRKLPSDQPAVDKAALTNGDAPLYLWAAYELARVQAVAAPRKEWCGKLDLERIQQHIDGTAAWVPRLGEIATKASTIQKS